MTQLSAFWQARRDPDPGREWDWPTLVTYTFPVSRGPSPRIRQIPEPNGEGWGGAVSLKEEKLAMKPNKPLPVAVHSIPKNNNNKNSSYL